MAETRKNAETDVTQNMIFHYIAQAEDMIITDTDYQAALQYYIDYYKSQTGTEYSAEEIEAGIGSRMIKEHALFTKVTEFLINNCTVTYK
jgi:FKBP-type peptidyl-prolyl cis-trans isomerase (trigger factor)